MYIFFISHGLAGDYYFSYVVNIIYPVYYTLFSITDYPI